MLVVWGAGGPVSAPAILEGLERPLTASALHSYLKRLEEKGFLSCKKTGKVNTYTAMVAREDYQRSEGESFLKKLYGSSISRSRRRSTTERGWNRRSWRSSRHCWTA